MCSTVIRFPMWWCLSRHSIATWVLLAPILAANVYRAATQAIYWPVLLTLTGVAVADRFMRWLPLRFAAGALAGLCLLLFLRGFELSYFQQWRYDAGSKRIAAVILPEWPGAVTDRLHRSLAAVRDTIGIATEQSGKSTRIPPRTRISACSCRTISRQRRRCSIEIRFPMQWCWSSALTD